MNKILEIKNLSKSYYTKLGEVKAIDDISFSVFNGEFLCIIGSSGCGKSTLLNIIGALDKATSGNIIYEKKDLKIGYMLQDHALFPWLSILDNACLGLKIRGEKTKENIEYVKSLLKKYGLEDFIYKYPEQLSGGMKQRVALIRTLAIKPDILLLDEPFSALDYVSRQEVSNDVYNIIKNEKKTVILITHDLGEALSLGDRVLILSKRPAKIKKEYDIIYSNKYSPIEKRNTKEFSSYYNLLWKDLDKNV